ncbi:MAG: hypothetical protein QOH58_2583 [Thermoleophilaceae bacterium]|nr:hypothetical protein [Thermoleophilaceae bacterium]
MCLRDTREGYNRVEVQTLGLAAVSLAVAAALALTGSAAAATLPAGFSDTLVTRVERPTALTFTPDGRMLITTQGGQLRVYAGGGLVATPAIDLSARLCSNSERGLLGVAVDPDFQANRHVFLYYTYKQSGSCPAAPPPQGPVNRVSRFTLRDDNTIDPQSETVLIDQIPSPNGNHNGGHLQFGKDNHLYVSVGDGACDYAGDSGCGGANDAARDRNVLLGKILRITANGGIPSDNPFRGADSERCGLTGRTDPGKKCQETFAWGLRNPFRLGFDPDAPGTRFFINDVGQSSREEIDEGRAGADYGWNVREGGCATNTPASCGSPPAGMTNPLFDYGRAAGCGAITGGAFVPKGLWPEQYDGLYLFGDYVCGRIQALRGTWLGFGDLEFGTNMGPVIDLRFGPAPQGQALYYIAWTFGAQGDDIRRIAYGGNRSPAVDASANPTSGAVPLNVTFDPGASDPDGDALTYDWSFGDGARSSAASPAHSYAAAGTYQATLRVTDSRGASATDTVRIDAGNTPPAPTIHAPTPDLRFRVGQTLMLYGSADDAQDGTLANSALSWTVLLRHASHSHPFLGPTNGNSIVFQGPAPEDLAAAATSFLEVRLTATDSKGLSRTVTRELRPKTVPLTFHTSSGGLRLLVDGIPVRDPASFTSWEGYEFEVEAPSPQPSSPGRMWMFSSWSDGGARSHKITTPGGSAEYVASFNDARCGGGVGFGLGAVLAALGAAVTRRRSRRPC